MGPSGQIGKEHEMSAKTTKTAYKWIVKVRGVCGGEPTIKGTRIPVRALVAEYKFGSDFEEILEGFPGVTPNQLHEAFAYYYDNQEEVERLINPGTPEEIAAEGGYKLTPEGFFVKDNGLAKK
jgi:uncharacterized protein (DUF433 family)